MTNWWICVACRLPVCRFGAYIRREQGDLRTFREVQDLHRKHCTKRPHLLGADGGFKLRKIAVPGFAWRRQ